MKTYEILKYVRLEAYPYAGTEAVRLGSAEYPEDKLNDGVNSLTSLFGTDIVIKVIRYEVIAFNKKSNKDLNIV